MTDKATLEIEVQTLKRQQNKIVFRVQTKVPERESRERRLYVVVSYLIHSYCIDHILYPILYKEVHARHVLVRVRGMVAYYIRLIFFNKAWL